MARKNSVAALQTRIAELEARVRIESERYDGLVSAYNVVIEDNKRVKYLEAALHRRDRELVNIQHKYIGMLEEKTMQRAVTTSGTVQGDIDVRS